MPTSPATFFPLTDWIVCQSFEIAATEYFYTFHTKSPFILTALVPDVWRDDKYNVTACWHVPKGEAITEWLLEEELLTRSEGAVFWYRRQVCFVPNYFGKKNPQWLEEIPKWIFPPVHAHGGVLGQFAVHLKEPLAVVYVPDHMRSKEAHLWFPCDASAMQSTAVECEFRKERKRYQEASEAFLTYLELPHGHAARWR